MRFLAKIIVRRILQLIPVLLGVTFLSFSLLNLLPGSAAQALLGLNAETLTINAINKTLGLNHPFFYRYALWLWHSLHGDLGMSFVYRQPVSHLIFSRFGVSAELVILGMGMALLVALPAAALSARKPYGVIDWITRTVSMIGLSVPGFVIALFLILALTVKIRAFPTTGYVPLTQSLASNLHTMFLPALSLSAILFGSYTRILRGDMVDQLSNEDYVLTARAKGIPERYVLIRHVFRNSIFSLVTVVGAQLGTLLGGGAILETIFGLPGVGQLLLNSIYSRDVPVVEGLIAVIACVVVVMNLVTDVSYMMIDPRVKYGAADN